MKTATSLVLGSIAAVGATAAAQAADFPEQGKPVEYLQVCPQYGDGLRYVPGTCGGFSLSLYAGRASPGVLGVDDNATPGVAANLRVDQSWGSARLKAALQQNRSGPLPTGAGLDCIGTAANSTACGYRDDKLGWAVGAGVAVDMPGLAGNSISFEANYAQGPAGSTWSANRSWRMWGDGRGIGLGWMNDNLFRDGTDLELTRSWSFVAASEHRWNAQWRTAVYGGYEWIGHGARTHDMACSRGTFTGSPSALAGLSAGNCGPDLSRWNFGARTQWNPHPFLDIGLDVAYHRQNTAPRGAGMTTSVDEPDHLSAMFRIQYNLRP